jgi:mono/diheme cytochrome c family protein
MLIRSRILFVTSLICASSTLALAADGSPNAKNTAAVHTGQEVFTSKCFQCHSVQENQTRFGPSLYGELKQHKKTEAQLRQILKDGKGKMPSFDGKLTPEDTKNLLAYLHTL